jgi:hypothetical protein
VRVGQHLGLHVARLVEEALDEALAAAERRHGLATAESNSSGISSVGAGDLQPAPAAAERGLDGDREAVLPREGDHLVGTADRVLRAGHQRRTRGGRDVPRLHLVTQGDDRVGEGPIQVSPASRTACANSAFSDRKP